MADIRPFRGYTPRPELAGKVASAPYDTLSVAEARPICASEPYSYLHVVKSQAVLPEAEEKDLKKMQAKGLQNLEKFIREGVLQRSEAPSFYVYRQRSGDHVQVGLVAGVSAKEYEEGAIRKHEFTIQAKEDMMAEHMDALNADAGPVILIYPDRDDIDALISAEIKKAPRFEFTDEFGVDNALWEISDAKTLATLTTMFAEVPVLYIADGHHRAAGSARIAASRRAKNPNHTGNEIYNHFLAIIFPAGQKRILDYNRVVLDLGGKSESQLLEEIAREFDVVDLKTDDAEKARPRQKHEVSMLLGGNWYRLTPHATIVPTDIRGSLDVSILQSRVLAPLLGIENPRTDPRIDFVGGSRGVGELTRRCNVDAKVAFALYPTSIEDLMQIADAGESMPPKSTWFDPKPLSGVIVRRFED